METIREGGFGAALKAAREAAGITLRELSDTTKVQTRYIEALEAEDWSRVPQGVIGRGFVRLIAREIDLDPADLTLRYCAARGEEPPRKRIPTPETNWRVGANEPFIDPKKLFIGAVVVLVLAVVGLLIWSPWSAKPPVSQRGAEPQATAAHRLEIRALDATKVTVEIQGLPIEEHTLRPSDTFSIEVAKPVTIEAPDAGAIEVTWDGTVLKSVGEPKSSVKLVLPKDLEALKP